MKKIIVTGANGFIGANLCNYLAENEYTVDCLVRKGADISLLELIGDRRFDEHLIYCDYSDDTRLQEVLSTYDVVIHLAAMTKSKSFDDLYDANVRLTEKIVNLVSKINNNLPTTQSASESIEGIQLIFISSQAALGPSHGTTSKNTESKEQPISWYGITKYLAEQKVKECKCNWTIIRPSSVYGEGDKDFLIFFKLLNRHLSPILGTKDKYISLIYVQDLVMFIEKCILNHKTYGKIIHASDGVDYTMEEFTDTLNTVMEKVCFKFNIPETFLCGIANILDYITDKAFVFNKQKALEITQDSWLIDSKESMELLEVEIKPDLYGNLLKTYRWYLENYEL